MNALYIFFSIVAVITGLLLLDQLWWGIISLANFWKILATLTVITIVVTIIFLIRNELVEDKRLKKDKYHD